MHLTAFPHQSPVNPDRAGLKLSTSAIAPQCAYPARKASAILQPISCVRPLLMPISYSPMNFPVLPNMRWTCWAWRLLRRVQVTLTYPEAGRFQSIVSRASLSKTYGIQVSTPVWLSITQVFRHVISTTCLKMKELHWCATSGREDWRIAETCWSQWRFLCVY